MCRWLLTVHPDQESAALHKKIWILLRFAGSWVSIFFRSFDSLVGQSTARIRLLLAWNADEIDADTYYLLRDLDEQSIHDALDNRGIEITTGIVSCFVHRLVLLMGDTKKYEQTFFPSSSLFYWKHCQRWTLLRPGMKLRLLLLQPPTRSRESWNCARKTIRSSSIANIYPINGHFVHNISNSGWIPDRNASSRAPAVSVWPRRLFVERFSYRADIFCVWLVLSRYAKIKAVQWSIARFVEQERCSFPL